MDNQEAIEVIKLALSQVEWDYPMDYATAFDMAISALEKQIPMKTLAPELGISSRYPIIIPCGKCGMELADRMQEYCPWCGQAIDWTEGEFDRLMKRA